MAPTVNLKGIMVAVVTPFTADGKSIDTHYLDKHINRMIEAGVHGLVPGGSTGEFTTLSVAERKQLIEQTVKSTAGRVPVVAGIGELSTDSAIDLAKHAAQAGAAAVMLVPPFYDAPNLQQLKEMLKEVGSEANIPVMYYNIPSASGMKLSPTELVSLSEVGVNYLKDTSGDGPALTGMLFRKDIRDKMTVFNGWDTLTFYGLAAGAKGSIWGATNFIPELSMQLWDALAVRGDLKKGREIWEKIFPLCEFLESNGNYAAGVKTAMELRGWHAGPQRKPFAVLQGEPRQRLAVLLKNAGVQVVE
ncbi:aldolase [Xylaria telfairii]|nr:aldolase [Xylaria telfairii]